MKNSIISAAFIALGMLSISPSMGIHAENTGSVVHMENQNSRTVFLGYLYATNVEDTGGMLIITASAPRETMLGTAPTCDWSLNASGQLVIKVKKFIVDGNMMEVAVRLSDGNTGIYYLTWN